VDSLRNGLREGALATDSIPAQSAEFPKDSSKLQVMQDSLYPDSIPRPVPPVQRKKEVVVSPDAFDGEIDWGSKDTMWFDKANNTVHLYGEAYVNYQSYKLNAGYIAFNFDDNEATAHPILDSLGKEIQKPDFNDGNQSIKAQKLRYNFSTHKAKIYHAIAKEGELFVHGSETKYIGKEADTLNHVETIYSTDGIITSCDADHPHFGIRASKLKVVPNKLAVLGFSILEIADIPTPLVLPFAFYPMFNDQRSGLILPNDYVFDKRLGYGLSGIGLYFPINNYYDLKITGDIYTRGSWGINLASRYKKRYKYTGNVSVSYFNARTEQSGSLEKLSDHQFKLSLSHNQDAKAHPYQKFGGSINFTLNGYDKTFNKDAATQLNNVTNSNLTYSHKMPNTIFSFNGGLAHSQNTSTGKINITFPRATLNMQRYFPFKRKKSVGKEKWYEKISIKYDADMKNIIDATDSTLFSRQTLEEAKYGFKHGASTSGSYSVFKYFSLSPSINYDEIYFFKERRISVDPTMRFDTTQDVDGNLIIDTTFGEVVIDTINTVKPFRNFSTSVNLSTKQYGKLLFNRGWLRGLRHQINYNVGFSYRPNTKDLYEVEVDADTRDDVEQLETYNIFVNGPYGRGSPSIRQMAINYRIGNTVEGKYYSKKDSTSKKFTLLKSFNISGNYNFAADSLKFSQITLSGNTTLFNRLISIRYSGKLDPYIADDDNQRINTLVWSDRKRPFRHLNSTLYVSTGMTIKQIADLFKSKEKESNVSDPLPTQESWFMQMFGAFRLDYDLRMTWRNDNGIDTFYISSHTIKTRGRIKLSDKWSLNIGHIGYDFQENELTYPDLGFTRDLHCWEMNFSWRPDAGQYTFYIGVRSTTLEFLKYRHGQSPLETSLPTF
jgi:hypothetical protein